MASVGRSRRIQVGGGAAGFLKEGEGWARAYCPTASVSFGQDGEPGQEVRGLVLFPWGRAGSAPTSDPIKERTGGLRVPSTGPLSALYRGKAVR